MHRFLTASALALCCALPAQARDNHALLIGASTYQNLKEKYWLRGPANDMDLVQTYLTTSAPVPFAPGNVTVLADGVDGAALPTLAAIRAEFAALTQRVGQGDFVYLHFSGHGSQAPALDPDSELDGLDELFLPVDIGPWNDTVGTVENALVDDEIGQMIAALRAKGATVWAVFDSCHSGTATRAVSGGDEVRLRKLDPGALGITPAMIPASRALPTARDRADSPVGPVQPGAGGFIAFYAAQTNETTPEMNMPPGKKGRRLQGVFTYTLFETLAEKPGITYGQLGQEILRRYTVLNLARSTPMFEGDLDQPVFGVGDAGRLAQWPLRKADDYVSMTAGSLHGIGEGAVMAVMASPADATDQAIGYVQVDFTDTFVTEAIPVAHADLAAIALDDIPKGAYLRKLTEGLDFDIAIALPQAGSQAADKMIAAADLIEQNGSLGARVRFVPAGAEADLRMAVLPQSPRPDAIWMLPSSGLIENDNYGRTPSVSTGDKDVAQLAEIAGDSLQKMTRALNVLRLGQAFDGDGLDVDVALQTKNRRDRERRQLQPLDTTSVPRLIPGDEVHLEATNQMGDPVDINVLYVDANFEISHMWKGRLQPGDTLKQGLFRIKDEGFGRDRVILVMTPAKRGTVTEDLSFLQQGALKFDRGEVKGGAPEPKRSGLNAALMEAGFGFATRAAVSLDDDGGPSAGLIQFELDAVPAQ